MKRIISFLLLLFIALAFYRCGGDDDGRDIDYSYINEYIYKNECTNAVTVSSYSPDYDYPNLSRDSIFTIESGKEHYLMFFTFGGFEDNPLDWSYRYIKNNGYTVVSDGIREFTHYYKNHDPLYSLNKYELVKKGERGRTYVYTFRDEDFE